MLADIQSHVTRYAAIIAQVTGIDVEVVDHRLIRIAGTGMYASGIGTSLQTAGEVYRTVMRTRKTVFMDTPRQHTICQMCSNIDHCSETLSVSTPITDGDALYGVIGLVCFKPEERERILARKDTYIHFIGLLAEALANKLRDQRQLEGATELLDLMLQILDVNNQGILVLNAEGSVIYSNALARQMLHMNDPNTQTGQLEVLRTGDSFSDLDEFVVMSAGTRHVVVGQLVRLSSRNPDFASVLVFDSLDSVARRAHSFAEGGREGGLESIIGTSNAIRKLKTQVSRIADSTSTVLISGESGTGKELFARAIHAEGTRRDGPFVAINCGAIPDTLLESELFGYMGGAFTGASRQGRIGKFELAQGGVIFLDEINAMPLYLQVKLLRVLQERSLTRLGSNRPIDLDIRVIAASNDDLAELVRQNMFRDDLYYRLNVIPLEVPPLRSRLEDLDVLAAYFFTTYCTRFGKPCPDRIPQKILSILHAYTWPGNIRELENAVEYMVNMMPKNGRPSPMHLPPKLLATPPRNTTPQLDAPAGSLAAADANLDEIILTPHAYAATHAPQPAQLHAETHTLETSTFATLQQREQQAIAEALSLCGADTLGKKQAAKLLGISLATLYRKLKD